VSTATDEQVVLDVDLTAIVPCTIVSGGCPNEATWALNCAACRWECRACDKHRQGLDEAVVRLSPQGHVPGCLACFTAYPIPLAWRPL
jgi:hypothetical protein